VRWSTYSRKFPERRCTRSPQLRPRRLEGTKAHGARVKGPKTAKGRRTIKIDEGLVSLLLTEKERQLRLVAGIPEGVEVGLSLVKLPDGALAFPAYKAVSPPFSVRNQSHSRSRAMRPGWAFLACDFTTSEHVMERTSSIAASARMSSRSA
jgi:hypothetical protein